MDASAVLRKMRRMLGEVAYTIGDEVMPVFTDEYLLEYVQDAAEYLEIANIGDRVYSIDLFPPTITPEPSTADGSLLATWAAAKLLSGDLSKKIRDGDLGIRFRTGLNEISTVEASRRVNDQAKELFQEFDRLVTLKLAKRAGGAERVQ